MCGDRMILLKSKKDFQIIRNLRFQMQKILIILTIFLISSLSAFGLNSLAENEWGNPYIGYAINPNDAPLVFEASFNNQSMFIPFSIPKSGYISKIKVMYGAVELDAGQDVFKLCIDKAGTIRHNSAYWDSATCNFLYSELANTTNAGTGKWEPNLGKYIGLGSPYYNRGEELILGLTVKINDANGIGVYTQSSQRIGDEFQTLFLHPMLPKFETDEILQSKAEGNTFSQEPYWYSTALGYSYCTSCDFATAYSYNPFIDICMKQTVSSDEYCYSLYTRMTEVCLEVPTGGFGSHQGHGEYFYYDNDDSAINTFYFGTSFDGDWNRNHSEILFEFYRLNSDLSLNTILHQEKFKFNTSTYAYTENYGSANFTMMPLHLSSPINIEENTYYGYTIKAKVGLGCCTDCLDVISTYDSFDTGGWQGDSAGTLINTSGVFSTSSPNSDAVFKLNLTSPVYDDYEDSQTPVFTNCINSPRSDCLFYDDMSYVNLYNLSLSGYIWNPELWTIGNELLYNNYDITKFNAIGHEFEVTDYDYNSVFFDYIIKAESGTTPPTMDRSLNPDNFTYLMYQFYTFCNKALLNEFVLIFIADSNETGSTSNSYMNLYDVSSGDLRPFGTYLITNGEEVTIHGEIFLNEKFYQISLLGSSSFNMFNEVGHNVVFPMPLDTTCTPDTFRIIRDSTFIEDDNYISIDTISFWGSTSIVSDAGTPDDYEFEYGNETLQDNALIEGAVGEILHNLAFTLGFKSNAGKLLFWLLLILVLCIIGSYNIKARSTQGFLIGFTIIFGVVIGWYFKFLPPVLFAFLILIVSIVGAIFISKLSHSGGK